MTRSRLLIFIVILAAIAALILLLPKRGTEPSVEGPGGIIVTAPISTRSPAPLAQPSLLPGSSPRPTGSVRPTPTPVSMLRPRGAIRIASQPGGATVLINDAGTSETTPASFTELRSGRYRVTLSLATFYDWEAVVEVPAGKTVNLTARLKSLPPAQAKQSLDTRTVSTRGWNKFDGTSQRFTIFHTAESTPQVFKNRTVFPLKDGKAVVARTFETDFSLLNGFPTARDIYEQQGELSPNETVVLARFEREVGLDGYFVITRNRLTDRETMTAFFAFPLFAKSPRLEVYAISFTGDPGKFVSRSSGYATYRTMIKTMRFSI
ncbi:MAG: PEGA domain-containing protein [Parcubacteria group bacterium]|nr:PEGA domain-containing protein [Parcubacteria group bacterium]